MIAILPFYLSFYFSFSIDLRSLRVLRLMKLFRASKAMHRFTRAFVIAKEEIAIFAVVTVMLLYLSAVGIYYFENEAQPRSIQEYYP